MRTRWILVTAAAVAALLAGCSSPPAVPPATGPPPTVEIGPTTQVLPGPGIPAEALPHVFERLYTARQRPERAENPSGLGLAIVKELVTAMGGDVAAGARPGGGARFTVRLPLA